MLSNIKLNKIKEHLDRAQNPLFFFDNDNDGLISFLLLKRYIGAGKGVVIRTFPDLQESYYRRVKELNPDYIFVLDKPLISQEFIDLAKMDGIPIVMIDHHDVEKPKDKWVNYFNSLSKGFGEPVSYLCYKAVGEKDDWLALVGCISDHYLPDFYTDFYKKNEELGKKEVEGPFDLLYDSEIGRIARILDFSLKDTTSNVVKMLKFMGGVKSPYDVLEENNITKHIFERYNEINKKYQILLRKARKSVDEKIIFFTYGGEYSLSSNLSNQLSYEFPDKYIVIGYVNSDLVNFSIRGEEALKITNKIVSEIPDSTGGGHKKATGAKIKYEELDKFKNIIKEFLKG